jgi:hypothetical protein
MRHDGNIIIIVGWNTTYASIIYLDGPATQSVCSARSSPVGYRAATPTQKPPGRSGEGKNPHSSSTCSNPARLEPPTLTMSCMAVFFSCVMQSFLWRGHLRFLSELSTVPFYWVVRLVAWRFQPRWVATSQPHSAVMCLRRGDYEADMHKLPEGRESV